MKNVLYCSSKYNNTRDINESEAIKKGSKNNGSQITTIIEIIFLLLDF